MNEEVGKWLVWSQSYFNYQYDVSVFQVKKQIYVHSHFLIPTITWVRSRYHSHFIREVRFVPTWQFKEPKWTLGVNLILLVVFSHWVPWHVAGVFLGGIMVYVSQGNWEDFCFFLVPAFQLGVPSVLVGLHPHYHYQVYVWSFIMVPKWSPCIPSQVALFVKLSEIVFPNGNLLFPTLNLLTDPCCLQKEAQTL